MCPRPGQDADLLPCNKYPNERERRHAQRWLAWLAFRMKDDASLLWWQVPRWLPATRIRTAYQVMLAVVLAAGFWVPVTIINRQPADLVLVPFGALCGLGCGATIAQSSRRYSSVPLRLVPRWPRPRQWVWLIFAAIVPGPAVYLIPGLLMMWSRPATERPAATPVSTYRDDRKVRLLSGAGLVAGSGIVLVEVQALVGHWWSGGALLWVMLVLVLVAGCVFALSRGAVSRLLLAELALGVEWHERIRFARLLRVGAERGILRQRGATYEFCDPALQRELVAFHEATVAERAQRWAGDSRPARTGIYDRLFSWLSPGNADRLGRDVGIGLCGLLLTLIITQRIDNFPALQDALAGRAHSFSTPSWEVVAGFVVMALVTVLCCGAAWVAITWSLSRVPGFVLRIRIALRRAGWWRRCALGVLAVGGLVLIVVASGPGMVWRAVQAVVGALLPAAFALAVGVWLFVVVRKWARGRRWARFLPDVVVAVVVDAVCVLLVDHSLLTAAPAAGLLFPLGGAFAVRVWRRMSESPRLAVRAGADIAFSLLLGMTLILLLLWLANLLAFPGVEVALLRAVLEWAGAVVDLPWWLWTALFAVLAALAVAQIAWPKRTRPIATRLRRYHVNKVALGGKRVLTGVHVGLLTTSLIGLAAPAALLPALQGQLRDAYAVDLRNEVASRGESVAYQEIAEAFAPRAGAVVPAVVLVELVTQIHRSSSSDGKNTDLATEMDLAYRLGQVQAAALTLGSTPPVQVADPPAELAEPVRDAGDLDAHLGELDTERATSENAKHQAEQAGELAVSALSNVVQVRGISDAEVYQILTEYLSGLIENSPLRERFAAWAERVGERRAMPSGADLVLPDPTKLENVATADLATALPDDPFAQATVAQRLAGESPITTATDITNQVRFLQEDSGPCEGCLPPPHPSSTGVDDQPGGDQVEFHSSH